MNQLTRTLQGSSELAAVNLSMNHKQATAYSFMNRFQQSLLSTTFRKNKQKFEIKI